MTARSARAYCSSCARHAASLGRAEAGVSAASGLALDVPDAGRTAPTNGDGGGIGIVSAGGPSSGRKLRRRAERGVVGGGGGARPSSLSDGGRTPSSPESTSSGAIALIRMSTCGGGSWMRGSVLPCVAPRGRAVAARACGGELGPSGLIRAMLIFFRKPHLLRSFSALPPCASAGESGAAAAGERSRARPQPRLRRHRQARGRVLVRAALVPVEAVPERRVQEAAAAGVG
jgi:hypothetical protein